MQLEDWSCPVLPLQGIMLGQQAGVGEWMGVGIKYGEQEIKAMTHWTLTVYNVCTCMIIRNICKLYHNVLLVVYMY